jgi:hypothetical protein
MLEVASIVWTEAAKEATLLVVVSRFVFVPTDVVPAPVRM